MTCTCLTGMGSNMRLFLNSTSTFSGSVPVTSTDNQSNLDHLLSVLKKDQLRVEGDKQRKVTWANSPPAVPFEAICSIDWIERLKQTHTREVTLPSRGRLCVLCLWDYASPSGQGEAFSHTSHGLENRRKGVEVHDDLFIQSDSTSLSLFLLLWMLPHLSLWSEFIQSQYRCHVHAKVK